MGWDVCHNISAALPLVQAKVGWQASLTMLYGVNTAARVLAGSRGSVSQGTDTGHCRAGLLPASRGCRLAQPREMLPNPPPLAPGF
jgi:hypothetical protein